MVIRNVRCKGLQPSDTAGHCDLTDPSCTVSLCDATVWVEKLFALQFEQHSRQAFQQDLEEADGPSVVDCLPPLSSYENIKKSAVQILRCHVPGQLLMKIHLMPRVDQASLSMSVSVQ